MQDFVHGLVRDSIVCFKCAIFDLLAHFATNIRPAHHTKPDGKTNSYLWRKKEPLLRAYE